MANRKKFHARPIALAAGTFIALTALTAHAGPGFGDAYDLNNNPFVISTFFASSPSGARLWTDVLPDGSTTGAADPLTGAPAGYDPANRLAYQAAVKALYPNGYPGTGKALRKFVDPLPLPGQTVTLADGVTQKTLSVASPVKWVNPEGVLTNDDYYEIALVEYSEKFHSDLPKATMLRGYVQIDHVATNSNGATTLAGSKNLRLYYPNSSGIVAFAATDVVPADAKPIMIAQTDANGKLTGAQVQARVFDAPHYLGGSIVATQHVPTRLKFLNLLPVGRAVLDANGKVIARNGDLFLPVDPSIVGAGFGPDGYTQYTQNRSSLHLHGGDTPWISDGTPHQWITPAGEADPAVAGSLAADPTIDPTLLSNFVRGVSAVNVPDMNDPGPGAQTLYFPNGQSARFEWYHDHAIGITRLNVMAGIAAGYFLTDAVEADLVARKVIPDAAHTLPLVLQEKSFVPTDIALQDARWSTDGWGQPGDMWYPHVYETVQDPGQATNFNAVGRWHWGPWFWPSFPALYALPTGVYGDVTTVPEAWGDTPLVNGVAYPTVTVDPTTYRLRILNASNDRFFTFNMFVADPTVTTDDGRTNTEVKMVPVGPWANVCAPGVTKTDGVCVPEGWTTDIYGHNGGVPDATTQGPTFYQIASEGGLLPGVAKKDSTPIAYLLDKGRAAVLGVDYGASGLQLANAERADGIVDFSRYAGKTLIVYNDSGAPVPAADPRNEYFTGYGDNSATGGAEDTRPGYGPNTRTLMQIVVRPTAIGPVAAPLDGVDAAVATLDAEIKLAYKAAQETPIVAQSAYNGALGTTWDDTKAFANIYTGSLKEPAFKFVPGDTTPAVFNSISVTNAGAGYLTPPAVTLVGTGSGATAAATLKIDKLHVVSAGSGYRMAPTVAIVSLGKGNGAAATATLKTDVVTMTAIGSGYSQAKPPVVTFSKPSGKTIAADGRTRIAGVQATGTAIVNATGNVVGVTITNPGSGYTTAPTVSFSSAGTTGVGAKATATGSIGALLLDVPDPLNPSSAGGGGYDNLATSAINAGPAGLTITISPPPSGTTARAAATGKVFDITLTNVGTGYTAVPTVTVAAPSANAVLSAAWPAATLSTATALTDVAAGSPQGSILVKTKAIQELFEPTYGRLNATLGLEIPFTSALTQTTIPLGYVDAPTEQFADGETQIWKITHNGVDTHPVHFHLLNVQLINRVGWDNFVSPPEPNELGWKETIKMSPLEDVIVAVRAKKPKLAGFGLPVSRRLQDPTQPEGAMTGFTQIDPNTGLPAPMANTWQDYGWEYVWHCHILGHEENDFMRAVVFNANEVVPTAATGLAAAQVGSTAVLSWADTASTEYMYRIERAGPGSIDWVVIDKLLANSTKYVDLTAGANASYDYRVVAVGASGESVSNVASIRAIPIGLGQLTYQRLATGVALAWGDASAETSYEVQRANIGSPTYTTLTTLPANSTSFVDTTALTTAGYSYRIVALNDFGQAVSNAVLVPSAPLVLPGAPSNLVGSKSNVNQSLANVRLSWRAPTSGGSAASYNIQICSGPRTCTNFANFATSTTTTYTARGLNRGTPYSFRIQSVNAAGVSAAYSNVYRVTP